MGTPMRSECIGVVERLARERGHGEVVDGWQPDVE